MPKDKLKEKILEILCGKEDDKIGIECKQMFGETADLIILKVQSETKKEIMGEVDKMIDEIEGIDGNKVFLSGKIDALYDLRGKIKSKK